MTTTSASLVTRQYELVALAAIAAATLSGFLIDQYLATRLRRLCKNHWLGGKVPVGNDGCVFLLFLEVKSATLAGLLFFCLITLGWVAGAQFATNVLATGAFLGGTKVGVALVTSSVNAHTNWLVDTQGIAFS